MNYVTQTGTLRLESHLDYETKKSHEVKIRVIDSLTGRWSESIVEVLVQDSNDHAPVFLQTFFNISISEAAFIGTSVLVVSTDDQDSKENRGVSYHIENVDGSSVADFGINSSSGKMSLRNLLDRETKPFHHIYVVASDTGTPPLSSSAQVIVEGKFIFYQKFYILYMNNLFPYILCR